MSFHSFPREDSEPLVPVSCRVTWTAQPGLETGRAKIFPRRVFGCGAARAAGIVLAPSSRSKIHRPAGAPRALRPFGFRPGLAPSGRSGVDGDKVFPKTPRKRRELYHGKRTRICQRNQDGL